MKSEFGRIMHELRRTQKANERQAEIINNLLRERYILVYQSETELAETIRAMTKQFHEEHKPKVEEVVEVEPVPSS